MKAEKGMKFNNVRLFFQSPRHFIAMRALFWGGSRMFRYLDIWEDANNPAYIGAVTFTNSEEYLEKLQEI
jgi:hypothetical protein